VPVERSEVEALTPREQHRSVLNWRMRGYPQSYIEGGLGANIRGWSRCGFACGYCGYDLYASFDSIGPLGWVMAQWHVCDFCGYTEVNAEEDRNTFWSAYSTLVEFDVNSTSLGINEVASYLVGHGDRIGDMSPRRVEQLVAHLLAEHGLTVELTRATKDRGIDILVLSGGGQDSIVGLVEVKHHRGTVGVNAVRELRGVQLRDDVGEATLVCTSTFSPEARTEAADPRPAAKGYRLGLLDMHDVAMLLDVSTHPQVSILTQMSELGSNIGPRASLHPVFVPGGTPVRSRHRAGAVMGHTPTGINALATLGTAQDGIRLIIPQTSRRIDVAQEISVGPLGAILASFDASRWPSVDWQELVVPPSWS
jgi:hypothetical protein